MLHSKYLKKNSLGDELNKYFYKTFVVNNDNTILITRKI